MVAINFHSIFFLLYCQLFGYHHCSK